MGRRRYSRNKNNKNNKKNNRESGKKNESDKGRPDQEEICTFIDEYFSCLDAWLPCGLEAKSRQYDESLPRFLSAMMSVDMRDGKFWDVNLYEFVKTALLKRDLQRTHACLFETSERQLQASCQQRSENRARAMFVKAPWNTGWIVPDDKSDREWREQRYWEQQRKCDLRDDIARWHNRWQEVFDARQKDLKRRVLGQRDCETSAAGELMHVVPLCKDANSNSKLKLQAEAIHDSFFIPPPDDDRTYTPFIPSAPAVAE